ncbi:hypothetical protein LDENG_00222980 [Lucifuga dentata]|nr:hypothetical protein LDENG_00222980 [Lucifuga dentata]
MPVCLMITTEQRSEFIHIVIYSNLALFSCESRGASDKRHSVEPVGPDKIEESVLEAVKSGKQPELSQ